MKKTNPGKNRTEKTEKEVQKSIKESNCLKSKIGQMEDEVQKLTEENSLKIKIGQEETNDATRHHELIKQNQKGDGSVE